MKIGDKVSMYSYDGFRRHLTVSAINIAYDLNGKPCFKTEEGPMFYMQPELDKHYKVGNHAFWVLLHGEKIVEQSMNAFAQTQKKYQNAFRKLAD